MTIARTAGRSESVPSLPAARFRAWLAQAEPGHLVEYHRGLLIWDRSPKSELDSRERRALGSMADAALKAAARGLVHLVQRRRGKLDFSYLAVKAHRDPSARRAR
jgi:hypothetical protein